MASMTVDLPDPVAPDEGHQLDVAEVDDGRLLERAEALELEAERSHGAQRLVQQLGEQGVDPLVGDALRSQELGEQLLRAAAAMVAAVRRHGRVGHVDAHVDDPRPEQPAHVVGQAGVALAADDHPQPWVVGDIEGRELVDRARAACAGAGPPSSRAARTSAGTPGAAVDDVDLLGRARPRRSRAAAASRSSAGRRRPGSAGRGGGGRARRSRSSAGTTRAVTAYSSTRWAGRSPPPCSAPRTNVWATRTFTASSRERSAQRLDQQTQAIAVALGVLERLGVHQIGGADDAALGDERQHREPHGRAISGP